METNGKAKISSAADGPADTSAVRKEISPAGAGDNGNECRVSQRTGPAIDGPLGSFNVRGSVVRPLRGPEELQALMAAAAADQHAVVGATHVVVERGAESVERITGYGSLPLSARSTIPVINVWLDSQRPNPRRSWELLKLAEQLAAAAGYRVVCVPCSAESPFRPHMERFGYDYLGEAGYFLKRLGNHRDTETQRRD